ncbi:Six-hairpin glycosidase [Aspergillus pseudoustus]|uniref:Six-hairpin glycosidase n=1 Tax=Aspergillus pseudoustus TaxID=1810923 RepID=A0ABR4K2Y6_9EURO
MATWIWHPYWTEEPREATAGAFVHFRKTVTLPEAPREQALIQITADTRYKLYINSKLVSNGPVKGDRHLWFYDQLDIAPYLQQGPNTINVRVLRFYYATQHATSFPRLHRAGLLVRHIDGNTALGGARLDSDRTWEAALDRSTSLPTDIAEDEFLHVYERVTGRAELVTPEWVGAEELQFPGSHGLSAPWKLSPRLIPHARHKPGRFKSIVKVSSVLPRTEWERTILDPQANKSPRVLRLPAGSEHYLELEAETHMTAFLSFHFEWPRDAGSRLRVTYSECYEDTPDQVPYLRRKGDRCDTTKKLIGPHDEYTFGGASANLATSSLPYHQNQPDEEVFAPFHFRTFRFLALHITVCDSADLALKRIDLVRTSYPLDVRADAELPSLADNEIYRELWTTSIRTLTNCMHDCFEDCPFYEQLQYAMDARSSALFMYSISGDDRLARQAIQQLHQSYSPQSGLTASRAPAHQHQLIPHFSLFWICMVADHFERFDELAFARQFTPTCDAILETFGRRIDPNFGLIRSLQDPDQWDFVDWAEPWKPLGIPLAAERTGFPAYTNMLYAYTLQAISPLLAATGRTGVAEEYQARAAAINQALREHCFDGRFFTDGLAATADQDTDYSQHAQIWAVLSGAATGDVAYDIIRACTETEAPPQHGTTQSVLPRFTQASTAMSFYLLRALAAVNHGLYEERFHAFWAPWRAQLAQNLTTWVEDNVSNRSDCHAWGCSPLYEFMVEVAGVHVVKDQEEKEKKQLLVFRPRVALFKEFSGSVPFVCGGSLAIARVSWKQEEVDAVQVSLSVEIQFASTVAGRKSIAVALPDGRLMRLNGSESVDLVLERKREAQRI